MPEKIPYLHCKVLLIKQWKRVEDYFLFLYINDAPTYLKIENREKFKSFKCLTTMFLWWKSNEFFSQGKSNPYTIGLIPIALLNTILAVQTEHGKALERVVFFNPYDF